MQRFLTILLIIALFCAPVVLRANHIDTPAGTVITNTAKAYYSNSGGSAYSNVDDGTNTGTVDTIYGISNFAPTSLTDYGSAGSWIGSSGSLYFDIINMGNASHIITVTNLLDGLGGVFGTSTLWTTEYYIDNGNGSAEWGAPDTKITNVGTFGLAEDATNRIWVRIKAAPDADDGSFCTNRIAGKFGISNTFTFHSTYTGFNGIVYGGTNFLSKDLLVIVQGPIISMAKSSHITNTAEYIALKASGGNDLVPGALVTYAIRWTNSGSGTASGLQIKDSINGNVTYVSNSMKIDNSRLTATWGNYSGAAATLSDASGAEDEGDNGAGGEYDGSQILVTYISNIEGGDSGTVYFQVTVK